MNHTIRYKTAYIGHQPEGSSHVQHDEVSLAAAAVFPCYCQDNTNHRNATRYKQMNAKMEELRDNNYECKLRTDHTITT